MMLQCDKCGTTVNGDDEKEVKAAMTAHKKTHKDD